MIKLTKLSVHLRRGDTPSHSPTFCKPVFRRCRATWLSAHLRRGDNLNKYLKINYFSHYTLFTIKILYYFVNNIKISNSYQNHLPKIPWTIIFLISSIIFLNISSITSLLFSVFTIIPPITQNKYKQNKKNSVYT